MSEGPARDEAARLARLVWQFGEPVQAVVFYAPETRSATDALGLKGGWMSYFGCRAAPMGAVGAAVVTAAFYVFRPSMVERAIPDAWSYATPGKLVDARWSAMDIALRRVLGDALGSPTMHTAARLAREAVESGDFDGRVLGRANASLTPPPEPHLTLWQALATLREHRGDGHVMSLVEHGMRPCEALVLQAATGRSPADALKANRGWTDDEWSTAREALVARGWLHGHDAVAPHGVAAREAVEDETDRLAAAALAGLGPARTMELIDALRPLAERVMDGGAVPEANNMGVPWPPDDST
ncbi:MAG TPA: hypothetical protein VG476_12020 [Acidimicrobiales bacterium]|nr:hypothetical protein [Acidimicrobiales bacterium]